MNHWTMRSSGAQPESDWVTVVDPKEQAFSIEIPKGWKAHGGMFRSNAVDARPFVEMDSPDGKINIRIGDASIPPYDLPNPLLQRLRGNSPFVAPYASGDAFAAKYGQQRFSAMSQNVQLTKTGQTEPTWGRGGYGIRITAGWAGFACSRNGEATGAFVYAETLLVEPAFGSAGKWYVIALGSVIAPQAHGTAAGDMLKRSYKSIALNPAWVRTQGQLIGALRQGIQNSGEMVRQIHQRASDNFQLGRQQQMRQADHFQWRMRMQASQVDNFNDVLLGQSYARDANGQHWVVPMGTGGQQWVDPLGRVRESAMCPGLGFSPLTPTSR